MFRLQLLHSELRHLGPVFDCLAFVLDCTCLQHLLNHDAVHLIEIVFDDLNQDCPFYSRFLPVWERPKQTHPRLGGSCIVAIEVQRAIVQYLQFCALLLV